MIMDERYLDMTSVVKWWLLIKFKFTKSVNEYQTKQRTNLYIKTFIKKSSYLDKRDKKLLFKELPNILNNKSHINGTNHPISPFDLSPNLNSMISSITIIQLFQLNIPKNFHKSLHFKLSLLQYLSFLPSMPSETGMLLRYS